jgi:integrase
MASLRKRGRVWYFRFVDADGVKHERKGCPDKRVTEEMAREAESVAARGRAGLIDIKAEGFRDQNARPASAHLDDFEAALRARGGTAKHARLFTERARRVLALARGARLEVIDIPRRSTKEQREVTASAVAKILDEMRLSDLAPSKIQGALASLNAGGRSLQTCNHHRAAVRAFARWARDDGRMRDDPLYGVTGFNAKEDRRHDRRTLSLDELRKLIVVAENGRAYRKMSGPARALCYRLAVATGLRYAEIKSIDPTSLSLAGASPSVTVEAGYTKNGDRASLPLPSDVAADLSRFIAEMTSSGPVFPLPDKGADMLKLDLAAAGIAYKDQGGLVFDFHALRCQCATLADQAGVSPRVVQKLMRHSTLELTGRYTRPRMVDIESAASSLPGLRPDSTSREFMAATGTDGGRINNPLAHYLPTGGDGSGRTVADAGVKGVEMVGKVIGRKPMTVAGFDGLGRDLAGRGANSGVRTRTGDLRIMRPPRGLFSTPGEQIRCQP